ncbi:MAG: hypothetical protein V8Q30_07470 [Acutalibacteraceae bacterium]
MKMAFGENPKGIYGDKSDTSLHPYGHCGTGAGTAFQGPAVYAGPGEGGKRTPMSDEPEFDMKCEALLPVLRRELPVHIHAHRADDIATAVRICHESRRCAMVLVHATEGHLIADLSGKQRTSGIILRAR